MMFVQRINDKQEFESSRIHPVGRPPKITSEIVEEICDLVIQGKSFARAAAARDISESTIYRWIALGKKQESEPIYRELVERLSESCEISEFEALQTIRKTISYPDNWRAAAWLLEHRFPAKYGKNQSRNMSPREAINSEPDEGASGVLVSIA